MIIYEHGFSCEVPVIKLWPLTARAQPHETNLCLVVSPNSRVRLANNYTGVVKKGETKKPADSEGVKNDVTNTIFTFHAFNLDQMWLLWQHLGKCDWIVWVFAS